ncbi:MAG: hypothetical protein AB1324_00635 [Candidatus Micrarchaeota archaeon]
MLRRAAALLLILLLPGVFAGQVLVYKNEGCGHCVMYMDSLMDMLERNGYGEVVIKDYMSDPQARSEVASIQERFGVPLGMQGHLIVLVEGSYLFEGHVPVELMEEYLKAPQGPVVVTQDSMDEPASYKMLMDGKEHECPIDQPIAECAASGEAGQGGPGNLGLVLPLALLALAGGFVAYSLRGN